MVELEKDGDLTSGFATLRERVMDSGAQLGAVEGGGISFRSQLEDVESGLTSSYADYRVWSQYSHAGKPVADLYTIEDETAAGGVRRSPTMRLELSPEDINSVLGLSATYFVQALLVWDRCTRERLARTRLDALATALGIAS